LEKYSEWWSDPALRLENSEDNIERIKELISEEFDGISGPAICSFMALVFCCRRIYGEECPSLSLTITSQIPLGAGLGSSASLSAALAGVILLDSGRISETIDGDGSFPSHEREIIRDLASTCENIFHSRSSGIDTTVIIEGGLIKYEPGNFEPFQINHSPRILIVETHVERSTAQLVEFVRCRRERLTDIVDGVMSALEKCVHKWLELFQSEDLQDSYKQQRELVEMNQHLLASLGVSHATLDAIVSAASEVGLSAKLTGAGGGGCAMVLLPPSGMSTPSSTSEELDVQIAVLQQLLNQKGFTSIESTIAEDGIRLDHYESNLP